ncbi:MAG: type II toxin-antitoxin system RelE/ParE family toxin [Alphaproteobacteria bacterium]|nr:type II toxin-antitoxin system RelE/ParE family toxin [Alphaproteobacteria bacterium]
MIWRVEPSRNARKSLDRLPPADRRRIEAALATLSTDPLAGDVVKLKGLDAFRRRVGDYRVIFGIDFPARKVLVFDILRRTTTTYR